MTNTAKARPPVRFRTVEVSDPLYEVDGLRTVTVKSPALGRRADVTVAVPHGVTGPLPAAILLHGVYGSHWAWTGKGGAHRTLTRLVGSGEIAPMVLVMPSDGLFGDGSGYVRASTEDAEAWIVEEVPRIAALAVPGAGEAGLCIGGLSMGGYGALRLAGLHADRYAAAAGMSSITDLAQMRYFVEEDVAASYAVEAGQETVASVLRNAAGRLPSIHIDCGADDPLIEPNRALHHELDDAGIDHEYVELEGGHSWEYWSTNLEPVLRFFDRALQP